MIDWKGLFTLGIVVAMSACSTSHKAVVGTSVQERDSVRTEQTDCVRKSIAQSDSISKNVTDIQHITTSTVEVGSNEETITERVVETTDTLGNKTTITDRTTKRSGKYDKQSSMDERLKHQEEQMQAIWQRLDSLSNNTFVFNHWHRKDSLFQIKDKGKNNDESLSIALKLRMSTFIWMAISFILVVLLFKKKRKQS